MTPLTYFICLLALFSSENAISAQWTSHNRYNIDNTNVGMDYFLSGQQPSYLGYVGVQPRFYYAQSLQVGLGGGYRHWIEPTIQVGGYLFLDTLFDTAGLFEATDYKIKIAHDKLQYEGSILNIGADIVYNNQQLKLSIYYPRSEDTQSLWDCGFDAHYANHVLDYCTLLVGTYSRAYIERWGPLLHIMWHITPQHHVHTGWHFSIPDQQSRWTLGYTFNPSGQQTIASHPLSQQHLERRPML